MEWVREITNPPNSRVRVSHNKFRIERINTDEKMGQINIVSQFFLGQFHHTENSMIQIPVPFESYSESLNYLAYHFTNVKAVIEDSVIKRLLISSVKQESIKEYLNLNISPIIIDYYKYHSQEQRFESISTKTFEVCRSFYTDEHIQTDANKLWLFLKNTFLTTDYTIELRPLGWYLDDTLADNEFIKAFSNLCKIIFYVKPNDMYVHALSLSPL